MYMSEELYFIDGVYVQANPLDWDVLNQSKNFSA